MFSRMVYSTLVESLDFFQPFFGYYFFNALLLVLQALHIFWAYLIMRMVYKFVFLGKVRLVHMKREGKNNHFGTKNGFMKLLFSS